MEIINEPITIGHVIFLLAIDLLIIAGILIHREINKDGGEDPLDKNL